MVVECARTEERLRRSIQRSDCVRTEVEVSQVTEALAVTGRSEVGGIGGNLRELGMTKG